MLFLLEENEINLFQHQTTPTAPRRAHYARTRQGVERERGISGCCLQPHLLLLGSSCCTVARSRRYWHQLLKLLLSLLLLESK